MAYLNKQELFLKLQPFGLKTESGINRLIREQKLPARFMSPRKPFFVESEVDNWLDTRSLQQEREDKTRARTLRKAKKQRRIAKANKTTAEGSTTLKHRAGQKTDTLPIQA